MPAAPLLAPIELAAVKVPKSRARKLGDIGHLVESIRELGLLQPIIVTYQGRLVAGLHRLEACRKLGWKSIPAKQVDWGDLKAEMGELDENLARNELAPLERAEAVKRRKEIYEALHPDAPKGQGGDRKSDGIKAKRVSLDPFTSDVAEKTGATMRSVQQDVQIAEGIGSKAKEILARRTTEPVAKRELLKVAREKPETQVAVAKKLASGEAKNVDQAKEQMAVKEPPKDAEGAAIPADLAEHWDFVTAQLKPYLSALRSAQRVGSAALAAIQHGEAKLKRRLLTDAMRNALVSSLGTDGTAGANLKTVLWTARNAAPATICPNCQGSLKCPGSAKCSAKNSNEPSSCWCEKKHGRCQACDEVGYVGRKERAA